MADEGAASDTEGVKDGEEVVDVGVEGGVAAEVEVVRVDGAGEDEVEENDFVVRFEVWEDALPHRFVGAEAVAEDDVLVAGAFYANVVYVED